MEGRRQAVCTRSTATSLQPVLFVSTATSRRTLSVVSKLGGSLVSRCCDEPRVYRAGSKPANLAGGMDVFGCAIPGLSGKGSLLLAAQGRRREPGRPTAAQSREWGIVLAHTSLSPADAPLASSSKDSAARGPSAGQAVLKPNLHPKRAALCTPSLIPRSFCTWLLRPPFCCCAWAPGRSVCQQTLFLQVSQSMSFFALVLPPHARRGFGAPSVEM